MLATAAHLQKYYYQSSNRRASVPTWYSSKKKKETGRGNGKGKICLWMGWLCRSKGVDWRWLTGELDPSSAVFISSAKWEIKTTPNPLVCGGLWVMVTSGYTYYTYTHACLDNTKGYCIKSRSSCSPENWCRIIHGHRHTYSTVTSWWLLADAQQSQPKLFSSTGFVSAFALPIFLTFLPTWPI